MAVDTLDDMETLFDGIDLGEVDGVDDDQRAGGDHAGLLRRRGRAPGRRRPSGSAARSRPTSSRSTSPRRSGASRSTRRCGCVGDMIEWCTEHMPRWHPVSISGYHIREAGSTAAQELAFTLKDGLTYVEQAVARGLDVDDFAPRLSLLLQRPHRLLRGDREVPRGAPDLGARAARHVRRQGPAVVADALPHPDRRRVADRPAAAQQHRAHRDRGARRRARRHAVAAHQLLRRGARAADRGGGADRAAHAADHRPRDRRREHDRPARRLVLRRGADRPDGGAGLRVLRQDRRARRHGRGGQARLPAARDRRRRVRAPAGDRPGPAIVVGVNAFTEGDERRTADPAHRPRARAQAGRAPRSGPRRRRDTERRARPRSPTLRGRPRPEAAT